MFVNDSVSNCMNETRTDNSERSLALQLSMAKQYRLGRHQDTSRKKYSKEENKKAIISYLKGKKDVLGFRKWMHQY